MTEDEMVGWHHRLNGHEFETPDVHAIGCPVSDALIPTSRRSREGLGSLGGLTKSLVSTGPTVPSGDLIQCV